MPTSTTTPSPTLLPGYGFGRRANVPNGHPHRFRPDTGRRPVDRLDRPPVAARLEGGPWHGRFPDSARAA
jgi:hypothetical protein